MTKTYGPYVIVNIVDVFFSNYVVWNTSCSSETMVCKTFPRPYKTELALWRRLDIICNPLFTDLLTDTDTWILNNDYITLVIENNCTPEFFYSFRKNIFFTILYWGFVEPLFEKGRWIISF